MHTPIQTPRLTLLPGTPQLVAAALQSHEAFQQLISHPVAPTLLDFFSYAQPGYMQKLANLPEADVFQHGYWIILNNPKPTTVIGTIGFKGPPDPTNHTVEIAYGIEPSHQSNGYATEALTAATHHILKHPNVKTVIAHTLPETNASTKILTKAGYTHTGTVIDPEDGPIYRWQFPA